MWFLFFFFNFILELFSCSVISDSLWPHGLQYARFPCPSPSPEFAQTHNYWVCDTIQPSHPLSSSSPPAFNFSQHQFSLIQFSHSVMSDSLRPHGPQHARSPCPSPIPRAYPDSCPLSQWCHPTISSSVVPFSSCLQSFPAPGSFQMSQLFTSGGQSTGTATSTSSPSNECSGLISFRIDWFDLLAVQGTFKSVLQHHSSKALILRRSTFFIVQLSHPYMTTGKTIALTR